MMPVQIVVSIALLTFSLTTAAPEEKHDSWKNVFCAQDQTIRTSVIECFNMIPDKHHTIMKKCTSEIQDIGEDRGLLLDLFCGQEQHVEQIHDCIVNEYQEQGVDPDGEDMKPTQDCFMKIIENFPPS